VGGWVPVVSEDQKKSPFTVKHHDSSFSQKEYEVLPHPHDDSLAY